MNPYIFRYNSIAISWFMVLTVVSIVLGYLIIISLRNKSNINKSKLEDIYFILIVIGFIGARLSYVLLNFEAYKDNLHYVFKLTHYNLNLVGGIFFALIGLLLISKMQKLPFYSLLEIYIIPFYLSMSIGVWTMFFDGRLIGKAYEGLLALKYFGKNRHVVVLYLSSIFILGLVLQLAKSERIKSKYKTSFLLLLTLGCYYLIKSNFTY